MIQSNETPNAFSNLAKTVSNYVKLLIEDTRLNAAEKLTRLFSAIALSAILLIIGMVVLVVLSIAVCFALASIMPAMWAFLIVAAVYLVLMVIIVAFRTQLLVNPIARFISRLLLPAPKPTDANDKPSAL